MMLMLNLIIYLLFFNTSSGFLKLSTTSEKISFKLIEKWLQNPLHNLPHRIQIKVRSESINEDMDNPYIRWFLQKSKHSITISTYEQHNFLIPKRVPNSGRDLYVILCNINQLKTIAKSLFQKAGVYFFVINSGNVQYHVEEIRDIFHYMWQKFFVYHNYLLTEEGVFVYDPFAIRSNNDYGKIIKYVGGYSLAEVLFQNMRGYPIRVQMFKSVYSKPIKDKETNRISSFRGVDGKVASLLQQHLNFTLILQDPDQNFFGSRLPNGSFNGAIGSAINNKFDVCLTGFFIKDYLTTKISLSVAVYDDKLCIYSQKARRISNSLLPLFSVHYKVWLCFILMAISCSVVWLILRILNIWLNIIGDIPSRSWKKSFGWQYVDILVNTWLAWIRNTLLRYPQFANERILVVSICLVSVIFGAVFECSLSAVYIHPLYFKDINTLQELDNSDLKIFYKHRSMADDLFFSDTLTLFSSLDRKLIYSNSSQFINEIAENGNAAGVSRYKTLNLDYFNMIVSNRIWIIPECPKYYSLSYIWPAGAPWGEAIDKLLLRFLSSGLIQKFEREMKIEVDIKIMMKRLYENHKRFRILNMSDLQLAFYVLIVGSLVSTLFFLGEISIYAVKYF